MGKTYWHIRRPWHVIPAQAGIQVSLEAAYLRPQDFFDLGEGISRPLLSRG